MNKIFIFVIAAFVLGLGLYFGFNKEQPADVTDFEECVAAGYPVMESYPMRCRTPDGRVFAEDIGNELEKFDLIRIDSPRPNRIIQSPLKIEGEARGYWFFEAGFPIKLYDENENLIASAVAQARNDWMTEDFVPFEAELVFGAPAAGKGTLVLEKDNPSGLPENADELRLPVKFGEASETMIVEIYFGNNRLDPEVSCNKVFPIKREILKTQAVGRAALEELLGGPNSGEEEEGYFTSINESVNIQSLIIENGTARADFDEQLQFQVGGSCRVAAIRAQITETLRQFPTVEDVVISINGRTEDILQP